MKTCPLCKLECPECQDCNPCARKAIERMKTFSFQPGSLCDFEPDTREAAEKLHAAIERCPDTARAANARGFLRRVTHCPPAGSPAETVTVPAIERMITTLNS